MRMVQFYTQVELSDIKPEIKTEGGEEPGERKLLEHVLGVQDQVENRLDSVEEQLDGKYPILSHIYSRFS